MMSRWHGKISVRATEGVLPHVRRRLRPGERADLVIHERQARDRGWWWRFAAAVAIFDHDTMTPAVPGATPTLTPDDLDGTRPSCRVLSLWLGERGYTVAADRYGVDRPAEL